MRIRYFAVALMSCSIASAADKYYFSFEEALTTNRAKDFLDPSIKLYWGSQQVPELAEKSRPDVYRRSGISISPFGGSKRHCQEAFENALRAMVSDARKRGYDAIVDIRSAPDGKPSSDPLGFECTPGYKTTEVPIISSFAVTREGARRIEEAEKELAKKPPSPARPPAKKAIFMPLDPVLNSPEAKAILGPKIKIHWGTRNAPAYVERFGPDEYSDDASVKTLGPEGACRQAVLNTLTSIVEDAKEKGYDSIIKVHSVWKGQTTPVDTDFECEVGSSDAEVELMATLANTK